MKNIEMDFASADSDDYLHRDRSIQFKRERRKARKVIVERLRRERIDRCLDQLKHWLQDSTLASQAENCTLEKADILELTVTQLRHMVASTETQCVYGYSACVQEVNDFLLGIRYDDGTRRRIVQHLCRRRPKLVPGTTTGSSRRTPMQFVESISADKTDNDHLGMFSADSTTDGATETCELGSTDTVINNTSSDTGNSNVGATASVTMTEDYLDPEANKVLNNVGSTDDDAVAYVTDAEAETKDADDVDSRVQDDVLSSVWRPW